MTKSYPQLSNSESERHLRSSLQGNFKLLVDINEANASHFPKAQKTQSLNYAQSGF